MGGPAAGPGSGRANGRTVRIYPVTGPPGAGKTTALIPLDRQYPQVARFGVRDYALRLAGAGDPFGLLLRENLHRDGLASNELVLREFTHFLEHIPAEVSSVAADGYPRDLSQCHDLVNAAAAHGSSVATVILVDVPDELVPQRVAARRVCGQCGLPVDDAANGCPFCGGPVAIRDDDDPARLTRRLHHYRRLGGADVRAYFVERDLLRVVDGIGSPADVRRAIASVLLDGRQRCSHGPNA